MCARQGQPLPVPGSQETPRAFYRRGRGRRPGAIAVFNLPGFISATPEEWLKHLPRYLKAISLRLERLARDPAKDRERSVRVAALWRPCRARLDAGERTQELLRFRFLIEEYRVSLFAQELGTVVPVSEARLARQWTLAARSDDRIEAARSRVSS
jgi:hypothetical protein